MISRPQSAEATPYYFTYINQVADGDICRTLEAQSGETLALLRGISKEQSLHRIRHRRIAALVDVQMYDVLDAEILEKGHMEDAMDLLRKFLGRAPNAEAFSDRLHLGRH